jgi:hypothetical protein
MGCAIPLGVETGTRGPVWNPYSNHRRTSQHTRDDRERPVFSGAGFGDQQLSSGGLRLGGSAGRMGG